MDEHTLSYGTSLEPCMCLNHPMPEQSALTIAKYQKSLEKQALLKAATNRSTRAMSSNVEKGIREPHEHDVLSGRGNFVNFHPGNGHFRSLVQKHKVDYVNCPKQQKGKFSRLIVDQIRAQNPPGRFLKQDPKTKLWNEIAEKKALDKTRQALREGAPELLKELSDENTDKEKVKTSLNEGDEMYLSDIVRSPELGVVACYQNSNTIFPMSQQCESHSNGMNPNTIAVNNIEPKPSSLTTRSLTEEILMGMMGEGPLSPYAQPANNTRPPAISDRTQTEEIMMSEHNGNTFHQPLVKEESKFEDTFRQPLVKEESLKLESVFQLRSSLRSSLNSTSRRGSSIMSCSLGDITESSLSQVFEESLRVSDLAPLREFDSTRRRSVTDIADVSVPRPSYSSSMFDSSMFESNNMSSMNFDDSLTMGSS